MANPTVIAPTGGQSERLASPTPEPGPGRLRPAASWLRHPLPAASLLAASLLSIWAVLLANGGGDMAAQYAWTQFAADHPGSAYNLAWYGGMHPVSYSVLTPYLMAWWGVRTTAVIAGTLSTAILARLLTRSGIKRPLLPALCGAAALSCDIMSGRITFSIGVTFALAATLAAHRIRRSLTGALAAGLLGVLATLASPVDGLFLLVVAPALFWTGRRATACALAAGPLLVVGATTLLFPFYGVQPYSPAEWLLVSAAVLPIALLAPKPWKAVRTGAWVYLVGNVLVLVVPSPIGSNVERLPLLLATAVLLAAAKAATGRRALALWLAFAFSLTWQSSQPVLDLRAAAPANGWTQYAKPLVAELSRLGADRSRVEVVPAATHVEASLLTPYVELARGWNRQVDVLRNPLFYNGTLTPASYRSWLLTWAVGYVVLPDTPLDSAAEAEGRIVQDGQSWLQPVWSDAHWKLYRVADATPLASPPSTVLDAGESELTVRVPAAGPVLLRVIWSPWLEVLDAGPGCLRQDGQWTLLQANTPGVYRIGARYALPRGSAPCPAASRAGSR